MKQASMARLLAVVALMPALAAAADVRVVGEHLPPSSMMEGNVVVGRETLKVREIMARAGLSYGIELLPWKRAYAQALREADTCIFSTTRTQEREAQFRWIGPLNEAEWVLYGLAERHLALRTLDDARGLVIGTVLGDARDDYLRQRGLSVAPVTQEWLNPQKLLLGRIDLWAVGMAVGSKPFAGKQWEGKVVPLLTFNRVQTYLACNKQLPEAQVAAMQRAAAAMRRDGSMAREQLR
ncbi:MULTISPECIES: substrate-binding periplasmic protein [Janthinobacterium]|uniref:substrate-binding periplasmic protein n=1 Tax=Janthinobacterium TaxID=29580 RepID=UPI001D007581|nr:MULTISPECIES: transporter substrate-binding domain-containing protein [Janthinobacterium]MCX7290894.1 transporter substrate-binding domain-containing protein [Janthinobacterium sp.]MED5595045.1 transporter substrate-binding domain-containing protein [Janthinobacterium sp. P210006]